MAKVDIIASLHYVISHKSRYCIGMQQYVFNVSRERWEGVWQKQTEVFNLKGDLAESYFLALIMAGGRQIQILFSSTLQFNKQNKEIEVLGGLWEFFNVKEEPCLFPSEVGENNHWKVISNPTRARRKALVHCTNPTFFQKGSRRI